MKKIISVFLVLVMLCGMLPMTMAATEYTSGNYTYTLDSGGNATITKYTGSEANLVIPTTLDGHAVTSIAAGAAKENKYIVNLTLPSGLIFIGSRAFGNCSSLKSVFIPKSLDYCAYEYTTTYGPFAGSDALNSITFESGATQIARNLFSFCNGLTEITIPDTVTVIDGGAFASCKSLKKVNFSKNLTSIGADAFQNCTALSAIDLPKSITTIDDSTFEACPLTDVVLPTSLTTLGSKAFGNIPTLKSVFIPRSLDYCAYEYTTTYGPFAGSDALNSITFESGATQIARNLFSYCNGLTEITIPDTVTVIDGGAFASCKSLKKVNFSKNLTSIGADAFQNCTALSAIELPNYTKSIEGRAFENCALTDVVLPTALTFVGARAFGNMPSLKSVFIPKSLDYCAFEYSTYEGAFVGSDNLNDVTFEAGITQIARNLFNSCNGLTEITIPETVTAIEGGAFGDCKNLTKVVMSDSVTTIGSAAFTGCGKLKDIKLSANLKEIASYCFSSCSALSEIDVPETVTKIADHAFADCTALASIDLGKVTKIDYNAFYNCDALTSVTIPGTVTSIGSEIFAYCDNLSEVNLSVNVTKIPSKAFFECPKLQKIILPFNVKEIGANAFANCTGLTEITIPRYTTTIAADAFSYPGMLTIYGVTGTRSESYANEIGATFVAIDKATTSLTLNRTSLILNKDESFRLIPEVAPLDFTGEVKWESSDKSVATVDAYGMVKAVKNGSTVITFTAGNLSVSCTVTVGEHTHSYTETVIVEPTCTTAGTKELTCSCGDVKTETIAALGHNFVDGVCTRCGEVDGEHTHSYTETVIVEPTCTTPGQKQLVCACGDTKIETIALLGHSYVDGVCSRCGATVSELVFTDIVEGTWYYDGVIFAIENGLMNGMGNNKFEPELEMTRAMLVTVLWRYAGSTIEGTNIFTDVPSGQWYTEAVVWAAHNELVLGVGNNRFEPDGVIDRQQLVTLLYRYAKFLGIDTSAREDLNRFPDANKVANWAKDAVSWAVAEGLLYGTTVNGVPHLDPNGSAIRCQVATFFMRFIEKLVET